METFLLIPGSWMESDFEGKEVGEGCCLMQVAVGVWACADGRWVTQSPAGTSEPQCRGLRRISGDGEEGEGWCGVSGAEECLGTDLKDGQSYMSTLYTPPASSPNGSLWLSNLCRNHMKRKLSEQSRETDSISVVFWCWLLLPLSLRK